MSDIPTASTSWRPDTPIRQRLGFELLSTDGGARRGRFATKHGVVETPAFMPVGTQAAVKCASADQVAATGAQVVLSNTYHLSNPERVQLIERLGGLHQAMRWPHSVLTDSGGFQVFSLKDRIINEQGVRFTPPGDGGEVLLTPERSMEIQRSLGADIVMAFDECVDHKADVNYHAAAVDRTQRWLQRCMTVKLNDHQHLFGIIQGGLHLELRKKAAEQVTSLELPGYAIGGVSVGEGIEELKRIVAFTAPFLPVKQVRYLMGVGLPEDLIASVERGMDIHDCVIPTRYAREGTAFTFHGKLRIKDKRFKKDRYVLDTACQCPACAQGYSRAYIRHLFYAGEILGEMLMTMHNLHFYQDLMRQMREAIEQQRFVAWRDAFLALYQRNASHRPDPADDP